MIDYFSLLAPEVILTTGALAALMIGTSRRPSVQRAVPFFALAVVAIAILWVWRAAPPGGVTRLPGIELGSLAWYVRLLGLSVGAIVLLVNVCVPDARDTGEYFSMMLFSLAGVLLTASADDLITLFLALELVSVPTYALVAGGSADIRASEAGVKYFFLGALAAAILIYGMTFLYGGMGTTRLSSMRGMLALSNPYTLIGTLLVLSGLAYKIAAVPLHLYVPDVYQGAASPITGMLGFFPKFAGFVAIIRLLSLISVPAGLATVWSPPEAIFWLLWIAAAMTMTVGNCLALFQTSVKRMLAYSSIAHSGYMLVAVLVGSAATGGPMRDGWSALLFYAVAYGVMNLGAFAVLAYVRVYEKPAEDLEDIAGLARLHPAAALALALCVFSLMGMPPTVGFFGKLYVFTGALSVGAGHPHHVAMISLAVIGLLNSAIAAAYYLRIIAACYLHEPREAATLVPSASLRLGLALCSAFVVLAGVWPRELFKLAGYATGDLRPAARILPISERTDRHAASTDAANLADRTSSR